MMIPLSDLWPVVCVSGGCPTWLAAGLGPNSGPAWDQMACPSISSGQRPMMFGGHWPKMFGGQRLTAIYVQRPAVGGWLAICERSVVGRWSAIGGRPVVIGRLANGRRLWGVELAEEVEVEALANRVSVSANHIEIAIAVYITEPRCQSHVKMRRHTGAFIREGSRAIIQVKSVLLAVAVESRAIVEASGGYVDIPIRVYISQHHRNSHIT